jgi:uncharacterized protein (TIGR02271 family)
MIIPIVEEVLVVEKRLILKEELHIRRQIHTERVDADVPVRRSRAVVERSESQGASGHPASKHPRPRR